MDMKQILQHLDKFADVHVDYVCERMPEDASCVTREEIKQIIKDAAIQFGPTMDWSPVENALHKYVYDTGKRAKSLGY